MWSARSWGAVRFMVSPLVGLVGLVLYPAIGATIDLGNTLPALLRSACVLWVAALFSAHGNPLRNVDSSVEGGQSGWPPDWPRARPL